MRKRDKIRILKNIMIYLEDRKSEAYDAQDIDLFNWYSNGWSQLYSTFSGDKFEYLSAVPERFFRRQNK